jgi:hypothetical protein
VAAKTVSDTFTRADASSLGRATSGHTWTTTSGAFAESGNKTVCTTPGTAFIDAKKTNLDLTLSISHDGTTAAPGVLFRSLGEADRMGIFIDPPHGVRLFINRSGAAPIYPGSAGTITTTPATYTVRVTAIGSDIRAYLNGVLALSHTLSASDVTLFGNATLAGIRSGAPFSGSWDDLTITPA